MTLLAASLRRDWLLARRRPGSLLIDLAAVLAGVGLLFYIGRFVGRGSNGTSYFAFAAAGLPVLRMNAAVGRAVQQLAVGTANGTFEQVVSAPAPVWLVVLAELAFVLLRALVGGVLLLATAALFGASFHLTAAGVAGIALGLLGAVVLFAALSGGVIGLVMVTREAAALVALTGMVLPMLSGAYFPLGTLPAPLETVALALPFRRAVELIRAGVLGDGLDGRATVALALSAAVALPLGLGAATLGIRRARRRGTLSAG